MKDYKMIAKKQIEWVQELERVSIRPVMVSCLQQDGVTPSIRYFARDHDWRIPYQFRRCLDNELFFDIDEKDWGLVREFTKPLIKTLKRKNIPYILAGSAGKGIHCSVIFDAIDYQKSYGFRQVREKLWHWILDETDIDESFRGPGRPYCNAVICFSDQSEFGKILREFGGSKNGRQKTMITKIPRKQSKIYESQCVFPVHIDVWKVPINILEDLNLKPRKKKKPLRCNICPVDREFVYDQSYFMTDWGRWTVKRNCCTACIGLTENRYVDESAWVNRDGTEDY